MSYSNASGQYAHKLQGKSPKSRIAEHRPRKRTSLPDSDNVRKAQALVLRGVVAASASVLLGIVVFLLCKAR